MPLVNYILQWNSKNIPPLLLRLGIHDKKANPVAHGPQDQGPLQVTLRLFRTSWRVFTGNIKPDDKWSLAAQNAYSIERDNHILRYFGWIPRYLELFSEIRKTRKIIGKLLTPSHIYLSMLDEMVSPKCSKIFKDNTCICVKSLQTSGHFYYSPEDQCLMNEDFNKMIQNVQKEISN